ncbi:CCA tRNA nucleotidyltransferase [Pelagibacterium sp. 26DY04]|uniref:CCA tRNA nucleotidyltransferase n=1 Tax=Pelagibacterium sp. 26DY04 TaxID=2967130 RepID=UPI00281673D4|nr:CCA tRNA nucleotidyltransferase [Pelagibacterium sp. 26DY04]WMT86038.1 CCA tRNA nucleotidyltransferase [Pelagibacterium sp. 26DY04]
MSREQALTRLAQADWLDAARPVFDCLDGAMGRTRAVGGIVRDTLLGRPRGSTDIDMATELTPDEVLARGKAAGLGAHPTGVEHGTVTLVHDGRAVEVTTLRRDVETFGRHARVAFGTDWTEDARRRDFTMNALYCGVDGVLFDPLGGLEDCLERRVRFIGDPDARIAEDRLRVYRYFRFAASHGEQRLEEQALAACMRAAGELGALSAERVGSEMMRLLAQPKCAATLAAMVRVGVLAAALFSPQALKALERLEALPLPITADMRLAAMELTGAQVAALRVEWRLSNATMASLGQLTAALELARAANWAELAYRHPERRTQAIALATALDQHAIAWMNEAISTVEGMGSRNFPISGADLLAHGMKPGPEVGAELKRLERLWIESRFELDRDGLLEQVRQP